MTALAGRRAVVTGASRGIGLAIAERFREAGAQVIRLARSVAAASSERQLDIPCDLRDGSAVREAVARILATGAAPDIVVNNAGAFALKPLVETSEQEFASQLEVNLTGPFRLLRTLLPHVIARGRGHVVTIGSVADHVSLPGNAAYGASKHGVRALHQIMALELAGTGIRTTLVSPGATDTALWDPYDPDARPDLPDRAAMLRPGDVADAVLFAVTRRPGVDVDLIRMAASR